MCAEVEVESGVGRDKQHGLRSDRNEFGGQKEYTYRTVYRNRTRDTPFKRKRQSQLSLIVATTSVWETAKVCHHLFYMSSIKDWCNLLCALSPPPRTPNTLARLSLLSHSPILQ